ncbi:MAG: hypothetical protein QF819_03005 [Gemmatimonadota bacterium]|nr:hypothetical protein [Gemmatimonadota bacterium]MDP6802130.1 hypothetical protein [Gemmatimonadota bacterium]MDP7032065.1 hypothetical protein [Gemmatimonadota bacterium]
MSTLRLGSTCRVLLAALLAITADAEAGRFDDPAKYPDAPGSVTTSGFGLLSFGITGGFQSCSLRRYESFLSDRADDMFASTRIRLEGLFPPSYAFGAQVQVRLTTHTFLTTGLEWTGFEWGDRDFVNLHRLGGAVDDLSVGSRTLIRTHPFFFTLGVGAAFDFREVRFALSTSGVLGRMRVTDTQENYLNQERYLHETTSKGHGFGIESTFTIDYYTNPDNTLFLEFFRRDGSATVELQEREWESSFLPWKRAVDFDGVGVRLGLRWI